MAGTAPKPFQMTQMMDLLLKCARDISKSARRQVKEFDEDAFTLQLQQLVKSVACPVASVSEVSPPMPAPMMSSPYAALAAVQPVARNSIDLLVLAHDLWSKGRHEKSLEHFALAMSTPGADELADALDGINNPDEDDDEDEDKPKKKVEKPEAKPPAKEQADTTSGDEAAPAEEGESFEVDADQEEPDFDEPSRLRQVTTELRKKQSGETARSREVARALANKMSISGKRKDRVRAARLLEG